MVKFKKVLITVVMVFVWGWTVFMGIWSTSLRGRRASIAIGILINALLALWYSYLERRQSKNSPDALKRESEELEE